MSGISKNGGVMYDLIKLEGGPQNVTGLSDVVTEEGAPYRVYSLQGLLMGDFDSLDNLSLPAGIYIYRHGSRTGKFIMR